MTKSPSIYPLVSLLFAAATCADPIHEHDGAEAHDPHHHGLFFSNLLVAESISPHSELRLKYEFEAGTDSVDSHNLEAGIEVALARWVSVELVVPYTFLRGGEHESHMNNLGVAAKFASFAFEEQGVLIGGGVELELPTGDDNRGIGGDQGVLIEPFITAGFKRGDTEFVGILSFGVPVDEPDAEKDAVDLEMGYHAAMLWHAHERVTLLVELGGETILAGDENKTTLNVTPGVKFRPFDADIELGVGVTIPLLRDREFEFRLILAAFMHF